MKKRGAALIAFLSVAALATGCSQFGPGIVGTPCPVTWVPSESIAPERSSMRARIQLNVADEEIHLELITEGRPEELVVVGLARFGVRLFAVHQRGSELRVDGASTRELEQIALWVMDALHRALWISPPPGPGNTPVRSWAWSDERVIESHQAGRLRREFLVPLSPGGAARPGTPRVTIDYLDSPGPDSRVDPGTHEGTISVHNPWCGYEAMIAPL